MKNGVDTSVGRTDQNLHTANSFDLCDIISIGNLIPACVNSLRKEDEYERVSKKHDCRASQYTKYEPAADERLELVPELRTTP